MRDKVYKITRWYFFVAALILFYLFFVDVDYQQDQDKRILFKAILLSFPVAFILPLFFKKD